MGLVSRDLSKVLYLYLLRTPVNVLIALLTKSHEPPSM